jgi:hypothetical protein
MLGGKVGSVGSYGLSAYLFLIFFIIVRAGSPPGFFLPEEAENLYALN